MQLRQLRGWLLRLFGVFARKQREREFAEELASHQDFHIADNLRIGMSPEEARRLTPIKLGGIAQIRTSERTERTTDARNIATILARPAGFCG